MFWKIKKLAARINELTEHRYRSSIPIRSFSFLLDEHGEIGARPPNGDKWQDIQIGERWKGRDLYAWLAAEVEVPALWEGQTIVGRFDFGRTGHGTNSGFESLLYVNGAPYQGVDSNHQEVFLPDDTAGSKVTLQFRLWSGLEGGGEPSEQEHQINRAELVLLDEAVDDLYFTALATLETIKVLDENQPEYQELLKTLDLSFLRIDWSRPGSEDFYQSTIEANDVLHDELEHIKKHHSVTIQCIGHTHIDVAWLWRLKHTREKAARSFSTVLRLMEKYPEYIFMQSQPQLYEYIKSDYPEIYQQLKQRIKEGRWEAEGAMWLESDCNIPSGESLVRQILLGTQFFRDEFGIECTYLWLPDVFGYSWALPQILKKSGIHTFMTTKISWNQYNRMPHDTFTWRGMDGSEVLTHFITTPPPNGAERIYSYNGVIKPHAVKGIWDNYQDKEINQNLLLAYGYGDGGGGVNRDMLEMRRRLNQMPGLPNVVTSRADDYFLQLRKKVENTDHYVHTWDGELYLEFHRGTYTSQSYVKKMNRKLELRYRECEWLNVLRDVLSSGSGHYPKQKFIDGWKIILRNQFHDIIPGSSIREVYEDTRLEYEEAEQIAEQTWIDAVSDIISPSVEHDFTVFNAASWERSELVAIPLKPGMETGNWSDTRGNRLKAQKSGDNWIVQTGLLPSMGLDQLTFTSNKTVKEETALFEIREREMISPYYEMKWNEQGQLTRIYDRQMDREVLSEGDCGNVLQVFEDKPLQFDAWDIDVFYQEKMQEVVDLQSVEVKEIGQLRAVVRFVWQYMDSKIEQDMVLYVNSRRIDFQTKVDWHEQKQLLKAAFPVDIRATEATYDIQFGNVKRPTHWNTSWDLARFESVGHQWADLSEQSYGVSLLNDCKYGYDIKDHVMRLSLIKSGTYPDPHADQGEHWFTYALFPHEGGWVQGNTVQEAWSLNHALSCEEGRPGQARSGENRASLSLFHLSVEHIMIDAVKKAENCEQVVVRVHEFCGARGTVELTSDLKICSWQECDLMERPFGNPCENSTIRFSIRPYEIKTFIVDMQSK